MKYKNGMIKGHLRVATKLVKPLTEAYPRRELAQGSSVWVVTFGGKQFEANINEGLQHGHPPLSARFSPLRFSYSPVHLQRGQGFGPVYWL